MVKSAEKKFKNEDTIKKSTCKKKIGVSKSTLKLEHREFIINLLKQNVSKKKLLDDYEEKFNRRITYHTISRVEAYYKNTGDVEINHKRNRILDKDLLRSLPFESKNITTKSEQKKCLFYRLLFEQSLRKVRPYPRIIYSDCIWFDLEGKFDDNNLWSTYDNNLNFFKKFIHKKKLGIWCAMSVDKLYKFTFFHDALTKDDYKKIIFDFMDNVTSRTRKFTFQQFESEIHSSTEIKSLLSSYFKKILNLEQPYCDMTLIKSIIWPYLQSQIYNNKPRDIEQLQNNIIDVLENITLSDLNHISKSYRRYLLETKNILISSPL